MQIISKYYGLIEDLEQQRIGVMIFVMMVQGCIIVPATLFAILNGTGSLFHMVVCGMFSFGVLVSNIAIAPIRIIVHIFVISTFAHIILVVINLFRIF